MDFAKRLIELRKERKETQEDISKLLHVGRSTIGEYERGIIIPPANKLQILSDHFSVSINYLLGSTNTRTQDPGESERKDLRHILSLLQDSVRSDSFTFAGSALQEDYRKIVIDDLNLLIEIGNSIHLAHLHNLTHTENQTTQG